MSLFCFHLNEPIGIFFFFFNNIVSNDLYEEEKRLDPATEPRQQEHIAQI